ncbi:MAG: hypothetical protein JWN24_4908 [Phycisphaerales bacterium]|nr:hypothetical protein [Phycisphaerales bacterium]
MRPHILIRLIATILPLCTPLAAAAAPKHVKLQDATLNYTALQPGQQAVAAVVLDIKPGFHSQSHTPTQDYYIPFVLQPSANPNVKFFEPIYPPGAVGKLKGDPIPLSIYAGKVTVYLPFEVRSDAQPGPIKIGGTLNYQVCDENSCYPPDSIPFTIDTQIVPAGQKVETQRADLFKNLDPTIFSRLGSTDVSKAPAAPDEPKLFGRFVLAHNSYILAFVAAFLAGIIFNAVPCVLPVLPLKAIGFYEVSQHNRAKCVAFGAVFSAGLVSTFGVLALIVIVNKHGWGELFSNVYFNITIVGILLAMAIGTFGAFTVNLPSAVYSFTPRHDTYMGNFLYGILTAVLSTPCTFGLFLGLLVWAASQPTLIGVSLVMTVGVGMASPYFLLSAFPELARRFPRTGPWSELVKQMMAFLLLGSAVFFARRFITPFTGADAFWWVLFGLTVVAMLYLIVRTNHYAKSAQPRIVAAVIAVVFIAGVFAAVWKIVSQPYAWTPYTQEALQAAQKNNRVVVVEFTAAWCSTCQYLEVHTLHAKPVVDSVKQHNVQMLKADLTSETAGGWPLLKEVNPVPAIPFTVVYGPGSSEPQKLAGIYSAEDLTSAIERAGRKSVASK